MRFDLAASAAPVTDQPRGSADSDAVPVRAIGSQAARRDMTDGASC